MYGISIKKGEGGERGRYGWRERRGGVGSIAAAPLVSVLLSYREADRARKLPGFPDNGTIVTDTYAHTDGWWWDRAKAEFRLTGTVLFSFRSVLTFRAQGVLLLNLFID